MLDVIVKFEHKEDHKEKLIIEYMSIYQSTVIISYNIRELYESHSFFRKVGKQKVLLTWKAFEGFGI